MSQQRREESSRSGLMNVWFEREDFLSLPTLLTKPSPKPLKFLCSAIWLGCRRLTFLLHLPFLHFKFLSSSPSRRPPPHYHHHHHHHHTGCAHYCGFACLLQSSMRGDETELPVAASAELHSSDRKSSTLGPRHSQQTNAGFLNRPYTHTHTHTHIHTQTTQRYSARKNLHCTVFSLNISICRK